MPRCLIFQFSVFFLWAISGVATGDDENPSLGKLHQAIAKLVAKHYPQATSHVLGQTIGFEYSTRVYVTRMLAKLPDGEAPLDAVRGPMKEGVWCHIWCRSGDLEKEPAYQRGEGVIKREFFKEHTYYPNDPRHKCHLMVTLRLPRETSKEQTQFVKDLRELLDRFGRYLPSKGE